MQEVRIIGKPKVEVESIVLPATLATSAKQDTGNNSLSSIDGKLSSQATSSKQDTTNQKIDDLTALVTSIKSTDGIKKITDAVTITGTVTSNAAQLTYAYSTAYEASRVAKATAGSLYAISGYNSRTSDQFIQVHDSSSLPADTSVPKIIFRVYAQSNFSFSLSGFPASFTSGIVVCNSSTGPTKTIGSADCWFQVAYL